MLIKYSNKFNMKSIKNLCKIKGIKFISTLKKTSLLIILSEYNACKIIQDKVRSKLMSDTNCPISHEQLKYPFISLNFSGKFFYYDFKTFVMYLNKTEDFRDPCTRQVISDKKLNDMNKLIRYYYGKTSSKILISKSMIKNNDLNIVTYCLYDLINEIEHKILTIDETYNVILPRFIYYIYYLITNHSTEDAVRIIFACKQSITNKIILDYLNLVEIMNLL